MDASRCNHHKASAARIDASERACRAVSMRLRGHRWDEIALTLGYADASGPWKLVHEMLARHESEAVEDFRAVENARLDVLQKALWDLAVGQGLQVADGESGERVAVGLDSQFAAVDRVLKIIAERSRLNGLALPAQLKISGDVGAPLSLQLIIAHGGELLASVPGLAATLPAEVAATAQGPADEVSDADG